MTDVHKGLAKDVAKELDRRKRRRRLMFLGAWAGLIVLAVLYLRCGQGWGTGGKGSGSGPGTGTAQPAADAGPRRCAIRVDSKGITVDGTLTNQDKAVDVCRRTAGADVVVTGDARQGLWDDLKAVLDAAKIPIFLRTAPP
jgi:hypothetical protein